MQYEFILKELLPTILECGFILHIYGNRPNILSIPVGVRHRGYLSNIVEVYKEIDLSLCPDFNGFGFKNKVQESLLSSRPVITTPLGARGQNMREGLIINSTPEEMRLALKKLSNRSLLNNLSVQMKLKNMRINESPETSNWVDDIVKKSFGE